MEEEIQTQEPIQEIEGNKVDELRLEILSLVGEYTDELNLYELMGVLEMVKGDVQESIQEAYDESE